MKETLLTLKNLSYKYDSRSLKGIDSLNLEIFENDCLGLIGPSGSGKSTALKLISGSLKPQSGHIKIKEEVKLSYVPQSSELDEIPVLQILMNEILYIEDPEKRENQARSILTLLNITNEINSLPSEISGGQKQRVIIAKALVTNPSIILLDEPFGHLDELLRFNLMNELFEIFKENSISVLWVTHETKEALAFSKRVAVLNHGKLVQVGSPTHIYESPSNLFTARFMGKTNIFSLKALEVSDEFIQTKLFSRDIEVPRPSSFNLKEHKDLLLLIKPELITLNDNGRFKGKFQSSIYQGAYKLVKIKVANEFDIWTYADTKIDFNKDQKVLFDIDFSRVHSLDEV